MRWTRINPGAGDIEGIQSMAKARQDRADVLSTTTLVNLQSAINEASSPDWTANAATAFVSTAQALLPEVQVIIAELANDAQALYAYAAAVAEVQSRLVAVRCQQDNATADQSRLNWMLDDLRGDTTLAPDPVTERHRFQLSTHLAENDVMLKQVEAGLDDLGVQRTAADRACVAALTSTGSRGNLAKLNGVNFSTLSTAEVLRTFAGLSAAEIAVLLTEHPTPTEQFWTSPPDPRMVTAWWAGLGAGAQAALIAALPIVIGNLNGVPFAERITANAVTAEKRYGTPGHSAAERAYLKDVFDPPEGVTRVNLVAFDPEHSGIIEMIGVLSEGTSHAITFVPGTFSNLALFYNGNAQHISNRLVEKHSDTVAFVYKDGPFPGGDDTGGDNNFLRVTEANDPSVAKSAGRRLARFETSLGQEPLLSDAKSSALGFSWGLANVTASEVAGAHYDQVLSLSGAWMPKDWKPQPGTSYSDYSYFDALQEAQILGGVGEGNNPRASEVFHHGPYYHGPDKIFVPGTKIVDQGVMLDNHNLIATSGKDNSRVLKDIESRLYE